MLQKGKQEKKMKAEKGDVMETKMRLPYGYGGYAYSVVLSHIVFLKKKNLHIKRNFLKPLIKYKGIIHSLDSTKIYDLTHSLSYKF